MKLAANLILLSGVSSLSCWTCDSADEADCVLKECQNDQDFACYTEFRSHGTQVWYKKGCKQKHACRNEVNQNRGYLENESKNQFQCNPVNRANSVCRCCCETTECNESAESCIKPPECPFPEITNGRFVCENSGNIGDKCDLMCNDGFECHGKKTRTLECSADGTWNDHVPSCEPIPTTTTTSTTTTTTTAKTRKTATTEKTTTTEKIATTLRTEPVTIAKTTKSAPFPTKPSRIAIDIAKPILPECPELETGVIGLTCSNERKAGSVCQFTCPFGYKLEKGYVNTQCGSDGEWSSTKIPGCLYRVVFTRKVSNTIKDRQPKLGKYFKPWNSITNGTLNPSDINVSPKSTDEKYDEFLMNEFFEDVGCKVNDCSCAGDFIKELDEEEIINSFEKYCQ